MVGSAGSSEPESVMGMGEVVNEAPRQRRRWVVPSVRPRPCHGSDQLVPVYLDQTVPVWCEEVAGPPSTKRRRRQQQQQDSDSRFGDGSDGSAEKSDNSTSCSEEELAGASQQVSFDVIASMYRSSLVEVCYKRCSARGDDQGWVLGALLLQQPPKKKKKKRMTMRQRLDTFAGRCSSRTELAKSNSRSSSISLLTTASVDRGMSGSNSQCRMNQLHQHHRDPNLYTSSMLTTSSSHSH